MIYALENENGEDLQCEVSEAVKSGLIPSKSIRQYESAYKDFKEWYDSKKLRNMSESVILAYFEYKIKKVQPTTLWSIHSMLKTTLNIKQNIDIKKYSKLVPYLKNKCVGYRPKKTKVLTKAEIEKFLQEAPDEGFLLIKVILIFGMYGACRGSELLNLTVDDIEDENSIIIVKVRDSKTHTQRTFTISNLVHIKLYRKYYTLRPDHTTNRRFFIKYVRGKCVNQVVGINKIRNTPKEIATFFKLPEVESYTGHCFRRSSAKLLADSGADIDSLERHEGASGLQWLRKDILKNQLRKEIGTSYSIPSASKYGSSSIINRCFNQQTVAASDSPSSSGVSFQVEKLQP